VNTEFVRHKGKVEVRLVFASHGVRKDENGAMGRVIA
jgi:hypothetical protein